MGDAGTGQGMQVLDRGCRGCPIALEGHNCPWPWAAMGTSPGWEAGWWLYLCVGWDSPAFGDGRGNVPCLRARRRRVS